MNHSRPYLAIQVERQITAAQVLGVLKQAMIQYGVPGYIRSDNGPEFIATKVQQWPRDSGVLCTTARPARGIADRDGTPE